MIILGPNKNEPGVIPYNNSNKWMVVHVVYWPKSYDKGLFDWIKLTDIYKVKLFFGVIPKSLPKKNQLLTVWKFVILIHSSKPLSTSIYLNISHEIPGSFRKSWSLLGPGVIYIPEWFQKNCNNTVLLSIKEFHFFIHDILKAFHLLHSSVSKVSFFIRWSRMKTAGKVTC